MAEHLTTDELIQKHLDRTASAAELAELERRLGDPTALEAFVAAGRMDAWLSTLLKEEAPIMPEDILKQTPKARRRSATLVAGLSLIAACIVAGFVTMWMIQPVGPAVIPDAEWKVFHPPEGHCEIKFPLLPGMTEPEQADVKAPVGGGPVAREFFVERKAKDPKLDVKFTLAYISLPPQFVNLQQFEADIQQRRLEILRSSKGKLRGEEQHLVLNGNLGRAFQIEAPKSRLIAMRMYLVEGQSYTRVYALLAEGPWAGLRSNTDVARFFDSLKLPPRGMGMIVKAPPRPRDPIQPPSPDMPSPKQTPVAEAVAMFGIVTANTVK
jgi:hypothetical protein